MDSFFWTTLITDIIHAFMIIGLGTLAAWFLISYYLKRKNNYRKADVPSLSDLSESKRITIPLRLQAYERIVLFLERIQPASMVMRLQRPEMSAQELQMTLTRTIREEFDYNLSQQVYISSTSWEMIKNAREESISIINRASAQLGREEPSSELVKAIFSLSLENETPVNAAALHFVKDEARLLM
jgi:hypothetical protein